MTSRRDPEELGSVAKRFHLPIREPGKQKAINAPTSIA
jgi:hypothetical protein